MAVSRFNFENLKKFEITSPDAIALTQYGKVTSRLILELL